MSQGRYERVPSDSFPGPLTDGRAITAAGGGTNITNALTVAQVLPFLNNTKHVSGIPWNFSTAKVLQALLCPYAWIVSATGVNAQFPTAPTVTDYSVQGQQPGGTGVTLSSLDTLANGQAVYIGASVPFAGVAVDMSAAVNGNSSTLTVEYWNGTAWVDLSATDNTASGGKTFAQDGLVTWTVPAAWVASRFSDGLKYPPVGLPPNVLDNYVGSNGLNKVSQYWTRWTVSAALDSSTVANTMVALNQSTAYMELLPNNVLEFRPVKQHGGVAGLQVKVDAGTCSLIVNCMTDNPAGAF